MSEQQIINEVLRKPEEFIKDTFFSIIEENLSDHPLHQAIGKLDLNAQTRIFSAINNHF